MKYPGRRGMILAGLTLGLLGCDAETKEKSNESHAVKIPDGPIDIATPAPPIEPSPIPSLPTAPNGDPEKMEPPK